MLKDLNTMDQDITKVNVDKLFEAFFNICDYFPHFSSNRISGVSATGLKEF